MFNFFKRDKSKAESPATPPEKKTLSAEETAQIEQQIQQLLTQIDENQDAATLAATYEKIGLSYHQLGDIDAAINYLEQSLQHKKSIGDGYKTLMSLYNHKRADAAQHGTLTDIDFWMNKMDEMRNIAKQVTIQRD